jgi:DNA invertase Pin-like site-specific DNA recombinase
MVSKQVSWAIYARISLDKTGAGLGVDRQIEDCLELGRKLGLKGEPVIYSDNDISASSGKRRPEYERLLDAMRVGRHKDLVVYHTDRLHRRTVELDEFIAVAEANKVVTHTVKAGLLDLATSGGRMTARIVGAVAQQVVEHNGENRARAALQSAQFGKMAVNGPRSFGYGRTVIDAEGKRHDVDHSKPNKKEAAALVAAFEAILQGETTTSIWRSWNKKGLTTQHGNRWNGSNFRAVISRPSLAGIVTYKGGVLEVEAKWPAIIERSKWERVQAIINNPDRRTSPGNTVRHLCSGVTFCECGVKLRASTNSIKLKSTGVARRYTVYRCSVGQAGHSTILKHVLDTQVRRGVIDAMYKAKDEPATPRHEDDTAELSELEDELAEVRAARKRLADAIADDVLTIEDARPRSVALRADEDRLKTLIESMSVRTQTAGMADEMWEALWAGIDVTKPVDAPNADGTAKFHGGRALLQSMMREGMTEQEAKVKVELARRFDELPLDQQRALVKAHINVTVRRGQAKDRVEIAPL